jgi:hypothetical protein
VALTAAMFFPVVANLHWAVPHDLGDPLLNTWLLWWNAIAVPFTEGWWNGPVFWPLSGALAFSEHLAGLSVLTTPLIRLGLDPLVVYNITFLLSWPLGALAAHALAYRLTGRHDAGFVAGLVFGFNPYRLAQSPHLQVLVSWWMPIALLALHQAVDAAQLRRRALWLAVFAACWLLQVLSNGYLLFYFSFLVVLWLGWFATRGGARTTGLLAVAIWAGAITSIVPMLLKYRAVHLYWGLRRAHGEILGYSADVLAFAKSSDLTALWRLAPHVGPEQELYPGLVAVLIVVASVVISVRRSPVDARPRWLSGLWWLFVGVATIFAIVAVVTLATGPWSLEVGPIAIAGARFRKPLTVALASLAVALVLSRSGARALSTRSVLAFYVFATAVSWLMCLGAVARFSGVPFFERPPYWWLIELPGFNALRVPTRFAIVGSLTLSIAAAVGFTRLVAPRRRILTAAILVALAADAWPRPMPMYAPPEMYRLPEVARDAAVIELPVRASVDGDVAAMYRGIRHGRPVINGYSGHEPPPYEVLRAALRDGDATVLTALATFAPVCVVIDRRSSGDDVVQAVESAGARRIGSDLTYVFHLFDKQRPVEESTSRVWDTPALISPEARRLDRRLFDGRDDTAWATRRPQRGGEGFVVPLSAPVELGGLIMSLGDRVLDYPRLLVVETSVDGKTWEPAWRGPTSSLAYRAVMIGPKTSRMVIPFAPRTARMIRLRQVGRSQRFFWSIAELELLRPSTGG